ncbi:MAG: GNAT family N-acetyltransferase [Paracoccaceae bacterium]
MIPREAREEDAAAIRAILLASFPTRAEADLVRRLVADGDAVIVLIVEPPGAEPSGDEPCGVCVLSRMTAPFPALGLGPLAVTPVWRRRGIGARLVREGLSRAATAGWRGVFVLGDPAYYERFGFSTDLAAGFESAFAGPCFMGLALGGALPARTGALAYPPAFDAM